MNIALLQTLLQNYNEEYEYKDIAIDSDTNIDIGDIDSNEDRSNSNNIGSNYKKNLFIIFDFSNVE